MTLTTVVTEQSWSAVAASERAASPIEHRSDVWSDGMPDASSLHGWITKIPLIFSQCKAEC